MSTQSIIPGVQIVKRPLQMIFLVDNSVSMRGAKCNAVNQGIPAALHAAGQTLLQRPEVEAKVRIIVFGTETEWHIGPEPVPLHEVTWNDIVPKGKTRTGQAINLLCDELEVDKMSARGYPPVCILISDGFHTDSQEYYDGAIARLNRIPWGKKAIRLVLAIGNKNNYDEMELMKFSNQVNSPIIKIEDYRSIVKYIQWATVAATTSATSSRSLCGPEGQKQHEAFPTVPRPADIW